MAEPAHVEVVLVAGASRAGVTSVADRLRERMPDRRFVELPELVHGQLPIAVVWVVSATAPMTPDECARAGPRAGAVVAVVNKIDDHRCWRQVLVLNAARLPTATWVAAAAAPRLGAPRIDDVATALAQQLADPSLAPRATARAREAERAAHARRRHQLHQLRFELMSAARHRCLAARAELLAEVSTMRSSRQVEDTVRTRCQQIRADLEAQLEEQVAVPADAPVAPPQSLTTPLTAGRRLETQLMVVLGAGFGVGVALVVARVTAALTTGPGWAWAAGGVAGLALTAWVVRVRGLLADRARWERWTSDVVAAVRIELEDVVAGRILAAMPPSMPTAASRRQPKTTDFVVTDR